MIYQNKEYSTISEIFFKAFELAKLDKNQAKEFFEAYIDSILNRADDINSRPEAEARAKRNIGYFAGYCSEDICKLIYDTFECSHPIFG